MKLPPKTDDVTSDSDGDKNPAPRPTLGQRLANPTLNDTYVADGRRRDNQAAPRRADDVFLPLKLQLKGKKTTDISQVPLLFNPFDADLLCWAVGTVPDVSSLFSYRLFDQACSLFASLQLVLIAASKKPITTWMASIEPWLTQVPSKWIWAELKTLEGYKARDRYKLDKAVNEVHRALRRLKARGLQLVEKVD